MTTMAGPTPIELHEALTNLAHRAAREFPKVGSTDVPTPWDLRHATINDLLDELDRARG